jgi:alpha-L-arabinofuranosidase
VKRFWNRTNVGWLTLAICVASIATVWMLFAVRASAQKPRSATITVQVDEKLGPIDPLIFGHFTEETLTSYEGGVISEILFDRKFSMPEERSADEPWLKGTGGGWEPIQYAGTVTLAQDEKVYYSAPMSQRITNSGGSVPAGIQQKGYRFVMPHVAKSLRVDEPLHLLPKQKYRVRLAIKSKDLNGAVYVALGDSPTHFVARAAMNVKTGEDWRLQEAELEPISEVQDAKFMVYTDSPGTIWVDSASLVRADLDENGLRRDVLAATKTLTPTNVRWPGGWFVSDYHWKDGIGPVDKRPARLNRAWNVYYSNDFGIDEYIEFSRKIGSDPYVVVNVGTGTPEEAAELVQYVNGAATSRWGRVRAQNGHKDPYRVKLWNIGNEEFLPTLGGTSGRKYAENYLAFARGMRAADPTIKLVAVGAFEIPKGVLPPTGPVAVLLRYVPDWGKDFLPLAGKESDYYAIHYYEPGDSMKGKYTAEEFNRAAMVIAEDLSNKLKGVSQIMDQNGKRIPIALDEWRMSLPKDPPPGISPELPAGTTVATAGLLGPLLPLTQAVSEATVFNMMQKRPAEFTLSSRTILYAYLIGLVGIRRDNVVVSVPGLMMQMYSTRDKTQSLRTTVESGAFDMAPTAGFPGAKNVPYLDVSARQHPDGHIELFVVNRNLNEAIATEIQCAGAPAPKDVRVSLLTSDKVTDWNTFDKPFAVQVRPAEAKVSESRISFEFPPHSVTRLTW